MDKEKVHQVITETSKGSKYYNQEEEKLSEVAKKVEMYQRKIERAKASPKQYANICEIVK